MTQFYLVEIKKNSANEFEHTMHWAFDEDANAARLKAESKYHEILAAAAVSEYAQHSATLLTSDGRAIMNQCYRHEVTPDPEPTPEEPEVTPEEQEVTPEEETPVEETTEESV